MKHLKFLPLLIAAAFYMPRVHAAEVLPTAEPGGLSMILIGLGLICLSAAGQQGRSTFTAPEH